MSCTCALLFTFYWRRCQRCQSAVCNSANVHNNIPGPFQTPDDHNRLGERALEHHSSRLTRRAGSFGSSRRLPRLRESWQHGGSKSVCSWLAVAWEEPGGGRGFISRSLLDKPARDMTARGDGGGRAGVRPDVQELGPFSKWKCVCSFVSGALTARVKSLKLNQTGDTLPDCGHLHPFSSSNKTLDWRLFTRTCEDAVHLFELSLYSVDIYSL